MEIYETVLQLLNLEEKDLDTAKVQQINSIISLVSQRLKSKLTSLLGKYVSEVPESLTYIVVEICVNRFNRIGSEGTASHSVDGESVTWADTDYFEPYKKDIDDYVSSQGKSVGIAFL